LSDRLEDRAYFTTAEDIILAKLTWFHMGGGVSERQRCDVLGVIQVQDNRLDHAYLRRWAERLGLLNLLASLSELSNVNSENWNNCRRI